MSKNPYRERCKKCENCGQSRYKWTCELSGHKVEKVESCPKTKEDVNADKNTAVHAPPRLAA